MFKGLGVRGLGLRVGVGLRVRRFGPGFGVYSV